MSGKIIYTPLQKTDHLIKWGVRIQPNFILQTDILHQDSKSTSFVLLKARLFFCAGAFTWGSVASPHQRPAGFGTIFSQLA